MGTIAARDCMRILQLTEQVIAASLLAAVQAVWIRIEQGELDESTLAPQLREMLSDISTFFTLIEEDRPTDKLLREMIAYIQQQRWPLYEK